MKILITGVHGFVGRNLYNYLNKNHKLAGIGRKNPESQIQDRYVYNLDITENNLKKIKFKPQIIIHCAGSGSVSASLKNKKNDFDKNVTLSKYIVNYIENLKLKPKLILFSSAAVYGNHCNLSKKLFLPISPYGLNKLKSEKIFEKFSKKIGFDLQILRFFSIYGVGLRKQLIWDACNKLSNKHNYFYGTGEEIRSWIHINDVCNFIDYIIKKPLKNNIIDVSGYDILKNRILLKKIFKLFNYNSNPFFNKIRKKGDPINQIYDKKIIKKLGWSPSKKIEKGLKEYLLWFKKNQKK